MLVALYVQCVQFIQFTKSSYSEIVYDFPLSLQLFVGLVL
jgi:hypothetical protein